MNTEADYYAAQQRARDEQREREHRVLSEAQASAELRTGETLGWDRTAGGRSVWVGQSYGGHRSYRIIASKEAR